jgi:hypothetical protein
MALREWVYLPSKWIEAGGLKQLRWGGAGTQGADNTAALMALTAIAHHADVESGLARLTYDQLCMITGLSRAKLADGLDVLEKIKVISRAPNGRSTFQLTDYNPNAAGWANLPAKGLYRSGRILAFDNFKLRRAAELHALKLYLLFATRRGNDTNMANISYDKIHDYSGIERNQIKTAVSFLASIGLVYVEHLPSLANEYGIANAYRLAFLNSHVHMGTRGRGMDAIQFDPL